MTDAERLPISRMLMGRRLYDLVLLRSPNPGAPDDSCIHGVGAGASCAKCEEQLNPSFLRMFDATTAELEAELRRRR